MLSWNCQNCGREFPAPRSGRDRCLACVVDERRRLRRMHRPSGQIGDRRFRIERRSGVDRRVIDIAVARERRRGFRRMLATRRATDAMAASL